jgi:homoserine dehydrogenase
MKPFNIAILGCGTVGGGVAKILLEMNNKLKTRTDSEIILKKIVELFPENAVKRFDLPKGLFCGGGKNLKTEEVKKYIDEIMESKEIDLVVETIGGTSLDLLSTIKKVLDSKKHLVTANKAMLATYGKEIFEIADKNKVIVGYEASVCGAIPIIRTVKESFASDEIISISGIMNGTSNFILSKMQEENLDFTHALKKAQELGYAESDPTLDINGMDAAHKLLILIKLAFGINVSMEDIQVQGIDRITKDEIDFANEMGCTIKLICFAEKKENGIYASVGPMMVKKTNLLSQINSATNAVLLSNKYSGNHILIGKGAGSLETATSIVSDIMFIRRYSAQMSNFYEINDYKLLNAKYFMFPYNIIFETEDVPGVTGLITTAIGNHNINIDTVGHNRHNKEKAVFSIATMSCSLNQIIDAVKEIKLKRPDIVIKEPKIIPILF